MFPSHKIFAWGTSFSIKRTVLYRGFRRRHFPWHWGLLMLPTGEIDGTRGCGRETRVQYAAFECAQSLRHDHLVQGPERAV